MDHRFSPQPLARWYMVGAIASFLVMALGCLGLAVHLSTDPAQLPLDERALFEAEPRWVLAASAIGFVAGAAGGLLLILKRRAAERLLLLSLAGMLVWIAGMFVTPDFRDLLSESQIAVVLAVLAVTWTIYWFARHSRQRGWLR
ncbi:MAG TPA: hypothetical protein VG434_03685 [Sphingomicrobium sp.]|nr:hypothetical protein [Sphingomicrobium sp.]